jgi:hypothetical protein
VDDSYARLAQSRQPLTEDDRALLARELAGTASMSKVLGGVGGALVLGAGACALALDAPTNLIAGLLLGLPGALVALLGVTEMRRAKSDAQASEKIVYVGVVTAKRVVVSTNGPAGGTQQRSETRFVDIDGAPFQAGASYDAVAEGQRVAAHCIRPGSPFRLTPA